MNDNPGPNNSGIDLDKVLADRAAFDSLVYTPWREAIAELDRRQADPKIQEYVTRTLPGGVPDSMRGKKSMVLFRHIATSNYEIHRFMIAADALESLVPLILEYNDDKFNDRNESKYFLGKLCFHKGMNKKGEAIWENERIIDFNGSNNKPLSSVCTTWGESLVEFHHGLFRESFPKHEDKHSDISAWLHQFGENAKDYYKAFFTLFLRDGILFENFFLDMKEYAFTKDIILPAILEIIEESGVRPLIVQLAPTEIEGDRFWHSHPYPQKDTVRQKPLDKEGV